MKVDSTNFERVIESADRIAILGHVNPDGDSVGCTTALFHFLNHIGKHPTMMLPGSYPVNLRFLDNARDPGNRIIIDTDDHEKACDAIRNADAIICLDMRSLSRTGGLESEIEASGAVKVLIDHHLNPASEQFDFVYSMTEISSACELLFWILMNLSYISGKVKKLQMDVARSLYTGMMTDTNNFANSVFPSTFEMASLLIARGVDKDRLQSNVLSSFSYHRMKLMGHLLKDRMHLVKGTSAAYMILSEKDKMRYRYRQGDNEGFVNLPLQIRSVKLSALFTEDFTTGQIRVSLRSKGNVDVNAFAKEYFNGGGHKNAAGGRLSIPLEELPAYFESSLKKFFKA